MRIEQVFEHFNDLRMNRRGALATGVGATLTLLGLGMCRGVESPEERLARNVTKMKDLIRRGANLRTPGDTEAVFQTRAGIDIPYSRLGTADRIRRIGDPVERV